MKFQKEGGEEKGGKEEAAKGMPVFGFHGDMLSEGVGGSIGADKRE